ncbi:MAG: M16 family metallopeptidase [Kiritimatiellia bacterium]|jgi:predicted Zn-dependent peptidase
MLDDVKITTLDNGCRIATSRIEQTEGVAIGFFARVGSRCEPAAKSGHSHFLEHMLFKGSAKRSARAISRDIESRGGNTNACTNYEGTVYYAVVPYDAEALALDVLGDMYAAPRLLASDVEKERGVILEELKMYHDLPDERASDLLREGLWSSHPLGRLILGSTASLKATTAESLRDYHAAYYNAPGTVIAAAGKVDHDRFVEKASRYAQRLPTVGSARCKAATSASPRRALLVDQRETEQVNAAVGFRVFGRNDPRRQALGLLNLILGGNMSSRLFQTMRERHGFAYSVFSSLSLHRETGMLQIAAGLDEARSVKAMAVCGSILAKLASTPIPKAELERARQYALGSLRLGLESARSHMAWVGNGLTHNHLQTPAQIIAEINAVKPEDIQAVAAELLRPENATLALVMPREGVESPEAHYEALAGAL